MQEYHQCGRVGRAALKASMDRKTAAYYIKAGVSPGERKRPRTWRTRLNPLETAWPLALRWLEEAPELEAKALFEHLLATRPDLIVATALRTFYRRVASWKRAYGPPKEVFFPQARDPGASVQVDWTHAEELLVTLGGAAFPHLLCHTVLPYSNWQWALPCRSESLLSLKSGLQTALWALGGVPVIVQTDQSSTATHVLSRQSGKRGFNTEYLALCAHLGLEPRTINRAQPNENGDVESANGHLKRRLKAHLTLRGSRDFSDEPAYAAFVTQVCTGANGLRQTKVAEEVVTLRPLPATRYPEAELSMVRVSSFSTVRVKSCAYSVPARLIGAMVEAAISETTVVIWHERQEVVRYVRSAGAQPRIDYRHIIASLVRKPGAFARYVYREELFPSLVFRQAYDRLKSAEERLADRRYVELLALAADVGEERVATAISQCLRSGELPLATTLEANVRTHPTPAPSALVAFTPQLDCYDALLAEVGT